MTQVQINKCYEISIEERIQEVKCMIGHSWKEGDDWMTGYAFFQTGPIPNDDFHEYTVARMTPAFVESGITSHVNALVMEWEDCEHIRTYYREEFYVRAEAGDRVLLLSRSGFEDFREIVPYGPLDTMARYIVNRLVQIRLVGVLREKLPDVKVVVPEAEEDLIRTHFCYSCGFKLPEDMMHPYYKEDYIPCMACVDFLFSHDATDVPVKEEKAWLLKRYELFQRKKAKIEQSNIPSSMLDCSKKEIYHLIRKNASSVRYIGTTLSQIVRVGIKKHFVIEYMNVLGDEHGVVRLTGKSPKIQRFQYDIVGVTIFMGAILASEVISSCFALDERGEIYCDFNFFPWSEFLCSPIGVTIPRDVYLQAPGSDRRYYVHARSPVQAILPCPDYYYEVGKWFGKDVPQVSDSLCYRWEDSQIQLGGFPSLLVRYPTAYGDEIAMDEVSTTSFEVERPLHLYGISYLMGQHLLGYHHQTSDCETLLRAKDVLLSMGVKDNAKMNCVQLVRPQVAKVNYLRYMYDMYRMVPTYQYDISNDMIEIRIFFGRGIEVIHSLHRPEGSGHVLDSEIEVFDSKVSSDLFKETIQRDLGTDVVVEESRTERKIRKREEKDLRKRKAFGKGDGTRLEMAIYHRKVEKGDLMCERIFLLDELLSKSSSDDVHRLFVGLDGEVLDLTTMQRLIDQWSIELAQMPIHHVYPLWQTGDNGYSRYHQSQIMSVYRSQYDRDERFEDRRQDPES